MLEDFSDTLVHFDMMAPKSSYRFINFHLIIQSRNQTHPLRKWSGQMFADRSATLCGPLPSYHMSFEVDLLCIPRLRQVVIWVAVPFPSASSSLAILLWPLALTRYFTQRTWYFLLDMWENPSRAAVSEILWLASLAPTSTVHLKSLKSNFFPILMLGLKFRRSSWACLHV